MRLLRFVPAWIAAGLLIFVVLTVVFGLASLLWSGFPTFYWVFVGLMVAQTLGGNEPPFANELLWDVLVVFLFWFSTAAIGAALGGFWNRLRRRLT
jgi:hypothetical protein